MESVGRETAVKVSGEKIQAWEFNRKGKLSVWNLFRRHQTLGLMDHFFSRESDDQPPATEMRFLRAASTELLPAFYELVKLPGRDIRLESSLIFLGKTSWMFETIVLDGETKRKLASWRLQLVNIGFDSRRPMPLPDWLTEKYPHLTSRPRPATVQPFDLPNTKPAFVYSVIVAPSDVDWNFHTSSFQYIRYCVDCATTGAKNGAYSRLSGDLLDYDVGRVELLFQNESQEGDSLRVESWEDIRELGAIKFQVKRGNDNIVQCKILFSVPGISDSEKAKL